MCRDAGERAQVGIGLIEDAFEDLRAVADLEDRHPDTRQRNEIALYLIQHGLGGTAGPAEKFNTRCAVVMAISRLDRSLTPVVTNEFSILADQTAKTRTSMMSACPERSVCSVSFAGSRSTR